MSLKFYLRDYWVKMWKNENCFGEALNKTQIGEREAFSRENVTEICGGWEKLLKHIKTIEKHLNNV